MRLPALLGCAFLASSCGGGSTSSPGVVIPPCGAADVTAGTTFSINGTAISPGALSICTTANGTTCITATPSRCIAFLNNDTVAHNPKADAASAGIHSCTEINGNGTPIAANGGTRYVRMLGDGTAYPQQCGCHDDLNPTNAAYQVVVNVTDAPPPPGSGGAGY
jgi:hypothetical protein